MASRLISIRSHLPRLAQRSATAPAVRNLGRALSTRRVEQVDEILNVHHIRAAFRSMAMQNDELHNEMAYSMAFADESDEEQAAVNWQFTVMSDPQLQEQLRKSRGQCLHERTERTPPAAAVVHVDDAPLPTTLTDALRPSQRAIVITECQAPFRIWNVNPAWENLCGYSFLESQGKTLGCLLRGQDTDTIAATNLVSKLLQGENEAGTTLVNYDKDGRRFLNRVRVGPLYNQANKMTHFVGVLQEVGAVA